MSALPEHADRVLDLEPLSVESTPRPMTMARAAIGSVAGITADPAVIGCPALAAAADS